MNDEQKGLGIILMTLSRPPKSPAREKSTISLKFEGIMLRMCIKRRCLSND